jgi:hypothetical protein
MGRKSETKLSSQERLARGLRYTAIGPVDIARGAVGVSVQSARSATSELRARCREARLAERAAQLQEGLFDEAAAVKEVVASLPQALQDARKGSHRRRRRLFIFGGIGLATVVGGAVAFTIVRRSSQPEPSTLPPSVEVAPRP